MKKAIAIFVFSIALILTCSSGTMADKPSVKYDQVKDSLGKQTLGKDPDGKQVQYADVEKKANKNKSKDSFKKVEDLPGFVKDDQVAKKGGHYSKKELMTYREFFDLGITTMLRHDIDPDRMVWVLISNFDSTQTINGRSVKKPIVTTAYDAETGEALSLDVTSADPDGLSATAPTLNELLGN